MIARTKGLTLVQVVVLPAPCKPTIMMTCDFPLTGCDRTGQLPRSATLQPGRGTHVESGRGAVARVDEGDQLVIDRLVNQLLGLIPLHRVSPLALFRLHLFELGQDELLDAVAAPFHEQHVDVRLEEGGAD